MLDKFNDPNFIPDTLFCSAIDDDSHLIILKTIFDGRICTCYLSKKEINYFELLQQTENKFLKLVYFECLKSNYPIEEQNKILNTEKLIPLYHEVALEIVKQKIRRYRPMWLVKDYIELAYPTISNMDLFKNVGNLLFFIISDEDKTHIRDIYFILKDFLGLKEKVLKSTVIPDSIFRAIDYWMNNIFHGNLSTYHSTKHLLEKIFDFYEKIDVKIDKDSKKVIIFNKYNQFYNEQLNNIDIDINNIQSVESHIRFIEKMIEITQKYCVNKEIKDDLIDSLRAKNQALHLNASNAIEKLPLIKGRNVISIEEIDNSLKPYEGDTVQEFIQKVVLNDTFIPDIPDLSHDELGISMCFPTTIYDENTKRSYKPGEPIIENDFYYQLSVMEKLVYFEHKLKEYAIHEFLGNVYAVIHLSEIIDEISIKMFQIGLEHYGRSDYFHSIQINIFQIERILRDLCEKMCISNLFRDEYKTVPKGLEPLIEMLREKNVLNPKILYFIEWLLSTSRERITKNIRNKIAHGIENIGQFKRIYTKWNALAIILIYLSLSKYKVGSNEL